MLRFRKTSFGAMVNLFKIEILLFRKRGRAHQHKVEERFLVLFGRGLLSKKVHNSEEASLLKLGSFFSIKPRVSHYMSPLEDRSLLLLVWYK